MTNTLICQVGLVKASVNFERLSLHSLKSYLKDAQIEINVEIELDPYVILQLLK